MVELQPHCGHLELYCLVQYSLLEQQLRRNAKRFPGGLVFKAPRLLYHSTLGSRTIKKKKNDGPGVERVHCPLEGPVVVAADRHHVALLEGRVHGVGFRFMVQDLGFRVHGSEFRVYGSGFRV